MSTKSSSSSWLASAYLHPLRSLQLKIQTLDNRHNTNSPGFWPGVSRTEIVIVPLILDMKSGMNFVIFKLEWSYVILQIKLEPRYLKLEL